MIQHLPNKESEYLFLEMILVINEMILIVLRYLNAENEMRRKFGSIVVGSERR